MVVVVDPSDEVVAVRVPPSDVGVVVVGCCRRGLRQGRDKSHNCADSRAVSNFTRLSKLDGEWQAPLLQRLSLSIASPCHAPLAQNGLANFALATKRARPRFRQAYDLEWRSVRSPDRPEALAFSKRSV
jgi:hypothetical protein